ncbi:uncharacterized protein LOC121972624 [Zingiber officinale]|uniref:uncharacterized protein LOC121972624 n=1 Tax=Zingiber officinale TaxID=94328 RepID=UPI001C4BA95D|nr:uncharacterized protein LOC121972624 [Zingiber officinale]
MGKALTNVEVAGRLIKWATELGEYNIVYQPRTAIKAQALADFLTEIHQADSEETWKINVDGSATQQGSEVKVLLISPQEDILQIAVQLNFRATNNEAEYETLLAGLQAARHVGVARVIIYSDSQLVTQQVEKNFEINSDKLQVYWEVYEGMKETFKEVTESKIPRMENGRADELAKIASSLTTWVLDKSIAQTFLIAQIDLQNNMDEPIDWRAPMISYLQQGILPTDLEGARLVRKKAHAYTMIGDQLYKRAFSIPLLKCLSMEEADLVLREMHLGCCGSHVGGRTLARKVLLAGYFWPTLQKDAQRLVSTCLSCQKYHNLTYMPTSVLKTSIVSCPFDQWGMDIVGPFPMTYGQKRFLLVAVDYFSKWVEAEALARIIERGLKVKLDHVGEDWVKELQSILLTYRMTPQESTSLTSFHLVYENEAVVPIEIRVPLTRRMLYDEENAERRLAELDLISETHEQTTARGSHDKRPLLIQLPEGPYCTIIYGRHEAVPYLDAKLPRMEVGLLAQPSTFALSRPIYFQSCGDSRGSRASLG